MAKFIFKNGGPTMKNKERTMLTLYSMFILMLLLLFSYQLIIKSRQLNEQTYKNELKIHQLQDSVIALERRIVELNCR